MKTSVPCHPASMPDAFLAMFYIKAYFALQLELAQLSQKLSVWCWLLKHACPELQAWHKVRSYFMERVLHRVCDKDPKSDRIPK
ncbi:hypothetical protein Plim_3845 [Planctopirus limnophila DSM 3776]|uniref:Uncharacterized protein n=1 Tax=Planctopirus limnophila (strain ATCC 43296 / DSM 3776 / IFAM 1008 / Mu 290) TaxID=521674 RepID=D5SX35_PLAL2|nr:hypothetical protein Plim_3845 [Planctopirus limnophila DSM 3776]